jgi:hypothetical protein
MFWRDHEGVRIVMTNRRKEAVLRYQIGDEPEVLEMKVSEIDTPPQIILRSGKQGNFHVADQSGTPFAKDDNIFGYATNEINPPVKILHGSALRTRKPRLPTPKKDGRMKVETRFGGDVMSFDREICQSESN